MSEEEVERPIIIKRIIKKGGGHHGGAWKVAYADFVTAMMAFFLLLWLLNVTTDEQKNAISDYFDPTHPKVSESTSGAGGVMGGLSAAVDGAMVSSVQPITQPPPQTTSSPQGATAEERAEEDARFKDAEEDIKEALQESPELASLAENLLVDMTPEGLRIQIVDSEGRSMFATGSAQMYDNTKGLLAKVAEIIRKLPNDISVRGHTDSSSYGEGASYTNWELSADRANSSRRVLTGAGFPAPRVYSVVGKADHEHLDPKNPLDPRNRRISVILLREELTKPPKPVDPNAPRPASSGSLTPSAPPQIGTFRKTPGQVEFP